MKKNKTNKMKKLFFVKNQEDIQKKEGLLIIIQHLIA